MRKPFYKEVNMLVAIGAWFTAHWGSISLFCSWIASEVIPFFTSGKSSGLFHLLYNLIGDLVKKKPAA